MGLSCNHKQAGIVLSLYSSMSKRIRLFQFRLALFILHCKQVPITHEITAVQIRNKDFRTLHEEMSQLMHRF